MRSIHFFFFICLVAACGCNFRADGKSNADRERECEEECAKMTSIPALSFDFMYYDSAEVDSVIVKEISSNKDTITHLVKAKYSVGYCCTPRKKVWYSSWELEKEIALQNEYLIIVNGEAPHVLKHLKMGAKPLCNMFDCDYEPVLKSFELDGELNAEFEYGITIRKK